MKAILSALLTISLCAGCASILPAEAASNSDNQCHQSSEQTMPENDGVRGIEAEFRRLVCLDGGEIEDVYRSLGAQFAQKPIEVLSAMENANVPPSRAAPMLVMLPLSYVDDPCAGRDELQYRRQVVVEIVNKQTTKYVFLSTLDGAIAKKKKHCLAD